MREQYPVTAGKTGMGGTPTCTIPSHHQESGYRRQICVSHARPPRGKWVWEADLCEPYPVTAGKVGMGGNSACTIPSHRRESGYGRQVCVSHTQSPPGKWVWEALPHAPYPVATGKVGMGGTPTCTIPSHDQESGYGRHPHMHHTQSRSGKWVYWIIRIIFFVRPIAGICHTAVDNVHMSKTTKKNQNQIKNCLNYTNIIGRKITVVLY